MLAAGRNLVMSTGTASGKTLVYNLAFAAEAVERPKSTALYLFPTKALARDQLRAVRALKIPQMKAAVYDGDTPRAERPLIRKNANLVMTNPDMLHLALLADHARWADFFFRLSLIVVDEAHVVSRRLRLARGDGAPPAPAAGRALRRRPPVDARERHDRQPRRARDAPDRAAVRRGGGGRRAVGREAVRALEPADHRRGDRRPAERAHRGVVADVEARARRTSARSASRGRGAPPSCWRSSRAARWATRRSARGSSRTAPATWPRTAGRSSGSWRTASCSRSRRRTRSSWASTSARSTPPCSPATRGRARRCGSRPGARAAATRTRSRSWWRRTIRSTSTSCTIRRTCSTSRPRRR